MIFGIDTTFLAYIASACGFIGFMLVCIGQDSLLTVCKYGFLVVCMFLNLIVMILLK